MHGKLQIDNNYLKYIVLLLFIGMWGSIGADPYSFLILFDNSTNVKLNFNIINCLNLIRSVFPIISLIFSIGIIVKYNMLSNQDRFIYILLAIQILQLLTTFASQNSFINKIESNIDHIGRYNWIISSIATIFIFIIANRIKQFEIKKLFYLSIFFLIIMILWFTFTSLKDFYTLDVKTSLYNLDVYRDSAYFLGHPMPRLTGLSRSILIIYILVMLVKTNDIKFFIFLKYTILIFLGSLLILYQSKFALVIFFFIKTYFFLDFKNKLKAGIIILFLVISQVSLFYVISSSRNVETIIIQNNTETKKEEIIKKKENVIHFRSFNHPEKTGFDLIQQVLLSGRVALWQDSLKLFLERPILGYGSMSDRIVFSKKRRDKTISNNPVSNAFVYSLLSGGLFALILLIYFWINIRQKIFKIFQFNKDHNYEVKIGSFLIFVILLRSLVENSMMLFGVDFIILLNSLYLTKQK